MAKLQIASTVFIVLIAMALIGGVATTYNQVSELDTTFNTGTTLITPFNITLSEVPVSFLNVTNGSIVVPADNYTIYAAEKKLQINSNETFKENNITVTYTYKPTAYISGIAKVLLGVMIMITLIGVALFAMGKGPKR